MATHEDPSYQRLSRVADWKHDPISPSVRLTWAEWYKDLTEVIMLAMNVTAGGLRERDIIFMVESGLLFAWIDKLPDK